MLAWAWLIVIIFLGILAGRRYGRLVSFAVMMELIQVTILTRLRLRPTKHVEPVQHGSMLCFVGLRRSLVR